MKLTNQIKNNRFFNSKFAEITLFFAGIIPFLTGLNNIFTNWDDDKYVSGNPFIKSFSFDSVSTLFTQFWQGNYHPLTMLTYMFNYWVSELNPVSYISVNILLHGFNCVLVFYIIRKILKDDNLSFWAALLFAVSTIHVESVIWISERKDVLYAFFYLSSFLFYVKFLEENKLKLYWISLFLFILSLLSKATAVTLPVAVLGYLLLFHKPNLKQLVRLIPFFILSLLFGIIAVYAQHSSNAIADAMLKSLSSRPFLILDNIVFYFYKPLFPFHLASFHPYLMFQQINNPEFYLKLFAGFTFLILTVFYFRKEKAVLFGILFFTINILLLLQIFPVGSAIKADRYAYMSSIGSSIFFSFLILKLIEILHQFRNVFCIILSGYLIFLMYLTSQQSLIWKDSNSLWENALQYYPNHPLILGNLGLAKLDRKEPAEAKRCLLKALQNNPGDKGLLSNIGMVYLTENKLDSAKSYFRQSFKIDPEFLVNLSNMALLYIKENKQDSALYFIDKAIQTKPDVPEVYFNRATFYLSNKQPEKALKDFEKCLDLHPQNVSAVYVGMGDCNHLLKNYTSSISFYQLTLEKDEILKAEVYEKIANSKRMLNDYYGAVKDYSEAIKLDSSLKGIYFKRANNYFFLNQFKEALADYEKSVRLDSANKATSYFNKAICEKNIGKFDDALISLDSALNSGYAKSDIFKTKGLIYVSQNNFPSAQKMFSESIQFSKVDSELYNNRGYVYLKLEEWKKAETDFRKAISLSSTYSFAWNNLGYSLLMQNKLNDAKQAIENAIRFDKNNLYAIRNKGIWEFKNKNFQAAITIFSDLKSKDPAMEELDTYIKLTQSKLK